MASSYYVPDDLKRCELEVEVTGGNGVSMLMDAWEDGVFFILKEMRSERDEKGVPKNIRLTFISVGRPYARS